MTPAAGRRCGRAVPALLVALVVTSPRKASRMDERIRIALVRSAHRGLTNAAS